MAKKEPEYGETTATREQAAVAPLPQEPPPVEPEQIAQQAAAPPQGAPPEQQAQVPQEGFTVRNPYMLLPPTVNFAQSRKTQAERNYDVGMLWEVLAQDPRADDLTRMIARSLTNRTE